MRTPRKINDMHASFFLGAAKRPRRTLASALRGRGVTRARLGGQLGSCGDWSLARRKRRLGQARLPTARPWRRNFRAPIEVFQYLAAPFPRFRAADRRRRKRERVYRQRGETTPDDPFDPAEGSPQTWRRRRRAAPPDRSTGGRGLPRAARVRWNKTADD